MFLKIKFTFNNTLDVLNFIKSVLLSPITSIFLLNFRRYELLKLDLIEKLKKHSFEGRLRISILQSL